MSLLVVVPSRGRPGNAAALVEAWAETGAEAGLFFGCDFDDPERDGYVALKAAVAIGPRLGMAGTLNDLAINIARPNGDVFVGPGSLRPDVIGFMGDDHRPRTPGWDQAVLDAIADLGGTGIVYGNDLIHGPGLPTAVFMSADIVRTLGYMAPPVLRHMFLDNYWKALGEAAGCLRYLPDVVIEHVHPLVGKAPEDDGYREVAALMEPDRVAYERFVADGGLAVDASKVRALRLRGAA